MFTILYYECPKIFFFVGFYEAICRPNYIFLSLVLEKEFMDAW